MSSLNLLCHSKTDAQFMQDAPKAAWSIPYVSVAFFPSLKHNFIAYPSSKVSSRRDCIFEIRQLWQSGFSKVYSNCCCWFEQESIKIGQSSHKMYSNNIMNFQESTTILNAHTKKVWKHCMHFVYIYIYNLENLISFSDFYFLHSLFRDFGDCSGVLLWLVILPPSYSVTFLTLSQSPDISFVISLFFVVTL